MLDFKPPTEFTPGPYFVKQTYDGRPLSGKMTEDRKKKRLGISFSKQERFRSIEQSPGPSSYNTMESYDKARKRGKMTPVMAKSVLGRRIHNGSYVVVGNTIQFDRTWISRHEKSRLKKKLMQYKMEYGDRQGLESQI